jgi:hypothetical protein
MQILAMKCVIYSDSEGNSLVHTHFYGGDDKEKCEKFSLALASLLCIFICFVFSFSNKSERDFTNVAALLSFILLGMEGRKVGETKGFLR